MAGLLTHLAFSLTGTLIILLVLFKSRFKLLYCVSFIVGNLISDMIDFGITGLKIWSVSPEVIMRDSWFYPLARFSHNFSYWVIIALVIVVIVYLLFKLKKVSKQVLFAVIIALAVFLIGVIIHLNLDFFIIEKSPWI